jgi:hypothetical protein
MRREYIGVDTTQAATEWLRHDASTRQELSTLQSANVSGLGEFKARRVYDRCVGASRVEKGRKTVSGIRFGRGKGGSRLGWLARESCSAVTSRAPGASGARAERMELRAPESR